MPRPPDKTKDRSDDSQEFGLERHRKRRPFLPPWLEERIGWIGIVALIVIFGLPIKFIVTVFVGETPIDAPKTHIVLTFGPAKVWKEGTSSHLQSATIKVKNAGSAPALGVQTAVRVRTLNIPLVGPTTLEPGAEGTYTGQANVSVREGEQLNVSIGCMNCIAQ